MGTCDKKGNKDAAKEKGTGKCDETKKDCPNAPKLVSLTVKKYATQTHVTGAKNWATIKRSSDDVIVEATTSPNNSADEWSQINWSGDSGSPVSGKASQRKISRSDSKKLHVEAELGGVKDHVDIWVLWASVTNKTSGTTPANAVQFAARYDATENLGAKSYNGGKEAVGKVVPYAKITPAGVHAVVKSGWEFKRERMSHDWSDGAKDSPGNGTSDYWNTAWVDDTSHASFQKLTPDTDDKIYDRDAPNIAAFGTNDAETYNNFRQWVEWNAGDADTGGKCSDKAGWYWQGRWKKSASSQVELKDVGTGSITLPTDSHYHP
ncbi:MAG: hypothetical protein ACK2UO_00320 [Caldilineaceae bacterium]|jgi:hypothetical protein